MWLGGNTEKFITFSVAINKEVANGKEEEEVANGKEDENDSKKEQDDDSKKQKTITYKLKFIDSDRFMQIKLSDLVHNLFGIFNKECKKYTNKKKIKSECDLIGFSNNRLNYRCKEWRKICPKSINEVVKSFPTTYRFCKGDLNKFVSLLRKSVCPYEYMDSCEKFDETSLSDKKAFYSELNLEDIIDEDYEHAQKVWKVFEIKNLGIMTYMFKVINYCLQMYLKTLEISVLKYRNLILLIFFMHQD